MLGKRRQVADFQIRWSRSVFRDLVLAQFSIERRRLQTQGRRRTSWSVDLAAAACERVKYGTTFQLGEARSRLRSQFGRRRRFQPLRIHLQSVTESYDHGPLNDVLQ